MNPWNSIRKNTEVKNMTLDLNIMVAGEAGQGIQTIGSVLGKTMVGVGLHVFADQDYESRIRGGHNFFRVRIQIRPFVFKLRNSTF